MNISTLILVFGVGFAAIFLASFYISARVGSSRSTILAMILGALSFLFLEALWLWGFYIIFRERAIEVMAHYFSILQERLPILSTILQHQLQQ